MRELPVLVAGCVAVHRTEGCLADADTSLTLWIERPTAEGLHLYAGDAVVEPEGATPVRGGVRLSLRVPEGARVLRVRASDAEVEVPLGPRPALPAFEGFRERLEVAKDEAGALAHALEAKATASPIDRIALAARVGNLHLVRGRLAEGETSLREALELSLAEGFVSGPVHHACALARSFSFQGRYVDARAILEEAGQRIEASAAPRALLAEGRAGLAYCAAFPARAVDNTRKTLAALRVAEDLSEKLLLEDLQRSVRGMLGLELLFLGRGREGIALLQENQDDAGDPCVVGDAAFDLGSAALVERARLEPGSRQPFVDPRPPLLRAASVYDAACPDPERQSRVAALLAWAALLDGRLDDATEALRRSKVLAPEPGSQLRVQRLLLEGRLALGRRKLAEARALFRRALALAELHGQPGDRLWALEGLAETLAAGGAESEAAAVLEEAETLVDELTLGVPLGEGRGMDFGAHERSTRRLVDLYLRRARPDRALATARRARARVLLGLRRTLLLEPLAPAERARFDDALGAYRAGREAAELARPGDWGLALPELEAVRDRRRAEERERRASLEAAFASIASGRTTETRSLPVWAPRTEEAYLTVAETPSGLVGFWLDATGLVATSIGDLPAGDAAVRASALITPFREKLPGKRRLHVLLPTSLRTLDVHAGFLDGSPLLERVALDYPLDIGAVPAPPPTAPPRKVVLLGNPSGNLRAAAVEASASAERLRGAGWSTELLLGPAATRGALLRALATADLLHFAGHAEFAGPDGWDSELRLAADGRLTLADVLSLPRVPPRIVLLGCEAARSGETSSSETLGVAHAFVAAGAAAVLAPTRPVRDEEARRLAEAFYESFAGGEHDLGEALRRAQLALRGAPGAGDWTAFRVLRP